MKILLILIAVDVAIGDKLNLGYLPPPGASLAGGDFNHNDLPFDLPKEIFKSTKSKYSNNNSGNKITENRNHVNSEEIITPVSYQDSFSTPSTTISYTQTTTMFPILEYSSSSSSEISKNLNNINEMNNLDLASAELNEYNIDNYELQNVSSDQHTISFSVTERMGKYNSTNNLKDISLNTENMQNKMSKHPFSVGETIRKQSQYNIGTKTNQPNNIVTPKSFSYNFDTSNGMHSEVIGTAQEGVRVKGAYSYIGDDGKLYMMEYTADENGFQPRGDHLPTSPPIPKEIQKVIEQAYKDKANGIFDDGSYSEEKYGYKNYMPQSKKRTDISHFITYDNALNNEIGVENRQLNSNLLYENVNKMMNFFKTIGTKNEDKISKHTFRGVKGIITRDGFKKGYEYFPPQNSLEFFENNALHPVNNKNENYHSTESPELSRVEEKPVEDVKMLSSEAIITKTNDLPENKAVENSSRKSNTAGPFSEIYIYKENPLISVNNDTNTRDREHDIKEDEHIMTPSSVFPSKNYVDGQDLSKKPEDASMLQIFSNSPTTPAGPKYSSVLEPLNIRMPNIPEYETVHDKNYLHPTNPGLMQTSHTESSPTSETKINEEFDETKQYQRYDEKFGYYY